jgi:hypothetical protein
MTTPVSSRHRAVAVLLGVRCAGMPPSAKPTFVPVVAVEWPEMGATQHLEAETLQRAMAASRHAQAEEDARRRRDRLQLEQLEKAQLQQAMAASLGTQRLAAGRGGAVLLPAMDDESRWGQIAAFDATVEASEGGVTADAAIDLWEAHAEASMTTSALHARREEATRLTSAGQPRGIEFATLDLWAEAAGPEQHAAAAAVAAAVMDDDGSGDDDVAEARSQELAEWTELARMLSVSHTVNAPLNRHGRRPAQPTHTPSM